MSPCRHDRERSWSETVILIWLLSQRTMTSILTEVSNEEAIDVCFIGGDLSGRRLDICTNEYLTEDTNDSWEYIYETPEVLQGAAKDGRRCEVLAPSTSIPSFSIGEVIKIDETTSEDEISQNRPDDWVSENTPVQKVSGRASTATDKCVLTSKKHDGFFSHPKTIALNRREKHKRLKAQRNQMTAPSLKDSKHLCLDRNESLPPQVRGSESGLKKPVERGRLKPPRSLVCEYCFAVLASSSGLTRHVKRVHLKIKPFICVDCAAPFSTKEDLSAHHRTHTGEKPYKCRFCPAAFCQPHQRTGHERCHTGQRPYMCEQCGFAFKRSDDLGRHMKSHGGQAEKRRAEKRRSCPVCLKRFSRSSARNRHIKKHLTGERYKCGICDAAYYRRDALKQHIETHSLSASFECSLCAMHFGSRTAYNKHLRSHNS